VRLPLLDTFGSASILARGPGRGRRCFQGEEATVNEHRAQHHRGSEGLPTWLNTTVILTLLALFVYNVVVVGEEGYPTNVLIAGLLGGYVGFDQFKRRKEAPGKDADPPPSQSPPPSGGGSSW
jgi:hypothetical protein